jgi:hypothetical protein
VVEAPGNLRHLPRGPFGEFGAHPVVRPAHDVQPDPRARHCRRHGAKQLGVMAENLGRQMRHARPDVAQRHRNTHRSGDLAQAGAGDDEFDRLVLAEAQFGGLRVPDPESLMRTERFGVPLAVLADLPAFRVNRER